MNTHTPGPHVVWEKDCSWKGHKVRMGYNQEAYAAECATLARVLRTSHHKLGTVTIFTDAQAAIWGMTSDDPGPGQKYAIQARRHIRTLRPKEPDVRIENCWCPSHQGIEKADEWTKLAAGNCTPTGWNGSASETTSG